MFQPIAAERWGSTPVTDSISEKIGDFLPQVFRRGQLMRLIRFVASDVAELVRVWLES